MLKTFKFVLSRTHGPMALKRGVEHLVLQYNHSYSNDDIGFTLTFLTAKSNVGKCLNIDFIESFKLLTQKLVYSVVFKNICRGVSKRGKANSLTFDAVLS